MENDKKVEETVKFEKGKSKGKKIGISLLVILLVLIIAGVTYYFTVLTNPTKLYQGKIKMGIDNLFISSLDNETDEKVSVNLGLDVTLDLKDELKENPIAKLVNDIDLVINTQMDYSTKESVINLNASYEKEKVLDVSLFTDSKNNKLYLYAKDILDYYIELVTNTASNEETASDLALTIVAEAKAKSILQKEFANIITEDMCSKEAGEYVLKTTNLALITNMRKALENLKTNKEFLECFKNQQETVTILDSAIEMYSTEGIEACYVEVRLKLDLFLGLEKVTFKLLNDVSYELVIIPEGDNISFVLTEDSKKISDGKATVNEIEDGEVVNVTINVVDTGKINIKIDTMEKDVREIERVDKSKVKKVEEIDMFELMAALSKIEQTKLGELITDISTMFMPQEDYYDDSNLGYDTGLLF